VSVCLTFFIFFSFFLFHPAKMLENADRESVRKRVLKDMKSARDQAVAMAGAAAVSAAVRRARQGSAALVTLFQTREDLPVPLQLEYDRVVATYVPRCAWMEG
jgi:hypothetical protein